ncbi:hypothetical protein [Azospirillum endophyticum]
MFECEADPAQCTVLHARLTGEIDQGIDCLRFHHPRAKSVLDLDGTPVFRACANLKRTANSREVRSAMLSMGWVRWHRDRCPAGRGA